MKRAILVVLIASLTTVPMFAQGTQQHNAPCAGLTSAQVVSLEHVNGEWHMKIKCAQGAGMIAMSGTARYRGNGLFNGWTEEKMREVYTALVVSEPQQELIQLG